MAQLMKWGKSRPENYYCFVSHLWLQHEDGRIEVCERRRMDREGDWVDNEENLELPAIHADYWGDLAWNTLRRGYFSQELGIVTSHIGFEGKVDLIDKLARKFRDAVYYCE